MDAVEKLGLGEGQRKAPKGDAQPGEAPKGKALGAFAREDREMVAQSPAKRRGHLRWLLVAGVAAGVVMLTRATGSGRR